MATSAPTEIHTIRVRIWDDPLIEESGHPVHCGYVETFYLPVIGPSATWALRRLAGIANARGELTIALEDFAASLGLGHGTARTAPVVRTLERLVHFGLARWHDDALEVRVYVPTLSERRLRRLPLTLQAAHHHAVAG
jgi:hypothetical protein